MFNSFIKDVVGIKSTYTNHIGLEFEIEGKNLPEVVKGWSTTRDASLRGESFEYVLPKPLLKEDLLDAVDSLKGALRKSDVYETGYAGTHVHINISDLTVTQFYTFACLYLSLEDVIAKTFGKNREGNLFCLRASDAEYLIEILYESMKNEDLNPLNTDNIRYASMNCNSIFKYGSLEFRGWRSDGDLEAAYRWALFLLSLKEEARQLDSPVTLLIMSSQTDGGFARKWFPELSDDELYLVRKGVRRVQSIAFDGVW